MADEVHAVDVETARIHEHSDAEPRSIVQRVEYKVFPGAVGEGNHDRPHAGCHSTDEDAWASVSGTEVGVEPSARWHSTTASATPTVEPSASWMSTTLVRSPVPDSVETRSCQESASTVRPDAITVMPRVSQVLPCSAHAADMNH